MTGRLLLVEPTVAPDSLHVESIKVTFTEGDKSVSHCCQAYFSRKAETGILAVATCFFPSRP